MAEYVRIEVPESERTEAIRRYLELEDELFAWCEQHPEDTPEEEALLDEMEKVWWAMTREERDRLRVRMKRV